MTKLGSVVLAAGLTGLALAAGTGATTRSAATVIRVQGRIESLALDGTRIAYDVAPQPTGANKVLVRNLSTGKTTKVSGRHTAAADSTSTGSGVFELAIAGSRVAWIVNQGGNTEGDDYLYASSVSKPRERSIAKALRFGESCAGRSRTNCAGPWLGGLVGSGNLIALNRWTTDSGGDLADGGLYSLDGTKLKQIGGVDTVQANSSDGGRVATLSPDGTVNVYSSAGALLLSVPASNSVAVALSGRNLVALTSARTLELYDARTGNHRKTLPVHGPKPGNLDVQGRIAVYTTGPSVHAVNLSSGKDRVVGRLRGGVALARIGSAGLAYTSSRFYPKGATLVFLPWAKVAAAVS